MRRCAARCPRLPSLRYLPRAHSGGCAHAWVRGFAVRRDEPVDAPPGGDGVGMERVTTQRSQDDQAAVDAPAPPIMRVPLQEALAAAEQGVAPNERPTHPAVARGDNEGWAHTAKRLARLGIAMSRQWTTGLLGLYRDWRVVRPLQRTRRRLTWHEFYLVKSFEYNVDKLIPVFICIVTPFLGYPLVLVALWRPRVLPPRLRLTQHHDAVMKEDWMSLGWARKRLFTDHASLRLDELATRLRGNEQGVIHVEDLLQWNAPALQTCSTEVIRLLYIAFIGHGFPHFFHLGSTMLQPLKSVHTMRQCLEQLRWDVELDDNVLLRYLHKDQDYFHVPSVEALMDGLTVEQLTAACRVRRLPFVCQGQEAPLTGHALRQWKSSLARTLHDWLQLRHTQMAYHGPPGGGYPPHGGGYPPQGPPGGGYPPHGPPGGYPPAYPPYPPPGGGMPGGSMPGGSMPGGGMPPPMGGGYPGGPGYGAPGYGGPAGPGYGAPPMGGAYHGHGGHHGHHGGHHAHHGGHMKAHHGGHHMKAHHGGHHGGHHMKSHHGGGHHVKSHHGGGHHKSGHKSGHKSFKRKSFKRHKFKPKKFKSKFKPKKFKRKKFKRKKFKAKKWKR